MFTVAAAEIRRIFLAPFRFHVFGKGSLKTARTAASLGPDTYALF